VKNACKQQESLGKGYDLQKMRNIHNKYRKASKQKTMRETTYKKDLQEVIQ
jgi:hypothetical protein